MATSRFDFLLYSKNLNIRAVVPVSPQLADISKSDSQLTHLFESQLTVCAISKIVINIALSMVNAECEAQGAFCH
jgi:hypothetical protein